MAECGEYHSLGKYYEGIQTLEEAVGLYQQIPPERMNGIPAIGINLHVMGTDKMEDVQADILSGDEIDTGFIRLIPLRESGSVGGGKGDNQEVSG